MKIIITESQFKRLVENIIKEKEYDRFNDPKALALINFLNSTEDKEYGFIHIKNVNPYFGMTEYELTNDKAYIVGTDSEANNLSFEIATDMLRDDPLYFTDDFIISHSSVLKDDKISHDILELLRNEEKTNTGLYIFDKLIDDFDQYVRDAIKLHGRESYIGAGFNKEDKSGDYYIYRME